MLRVPRPRIGRVGIKQAVDLVEQIGVGAFPGVVLMQRRRDRLGVQRVDDSPPCYRVGSLTDVEEVRGEPIWRDLAVRIGTQQRAAKRQQASRETHRPIPGLASALLLRRKLVLKHMQGIRQPRLHAAGDVSGCIA